MTKIVKTGSVRIDEIDGVLAFVGADWQTGETVLLRHAPTYVRYTPGPLPPHLDERNALDYANAVAYDPAAADPPNQVGYTTSPRGYDFGCTFEIETFTCQVYPGEATREYRKVLILGGSDWGCFGESQTCRYENWTVTDPRETRDRFAAETAAIAAKTAAEAERIASDEAKLKTMTVDELRAELAQRVKIFDLDCITDKITGADVRRCSAALTAAETMVAAKAWAEVKAKIVTGRAILVPAEPAVERTDPWEIRNFGRWIEGKDAHLIEIVSVPEASFWAASMPIEERCITAKRDNGGAISVSAQDIAALCAAPGAIQDEGRWPTLAQRQKLFKRLGASVLDLCEYRHTDGARYWVGQVRYSSEWLVLDDDAKICRKKAATAGAVTAAEKKKYGAR